MQHDLRDCGPACLASICRYYGKETSLAIVREITKTDSDGTNLLGLVNGATELGFKADALGGNFNELEEGILDDSISLPFIAHTIGDGGLLHFVVVYKLNDKAVLIADPARGKRKISLEEFKMRWSGNIVSLKPSATFVKEKRFLPTLRFFGSLVANSKGLAAGILCSSIVLALTGIAAAYVFQFIVDDVVGMSAQLEQAMLIQRLAMICLAVAGLFIFEAVLKVVRGIGIAHFSRKLDAAIILKSYNHAIRLTYAFFATRKTGEIISRFSDAKSVRDMLSSATFSVVVDGLMVIFGAIILWAISPVLTCIAFAAAALYLLVVLAYRGRIQRISQATMEANAQVTSYFKESIDGIETVKALNIEPEIQRKTAGLYAKLLANSFKQNVMNNNLNSIVAALGSLATIAILWVGVHGVLQGTLTLGELITFNALLGYFLSPIGSLIGLQPQLQAVGVAVNRLNDIMLAQSEDAGFNSSALDNSNNNVENNTEDFSGDDLLQASKFCNDISLGKSDRLDKMYAKDLSLIGDIVFSNVCFRYGNRDLTLDNVSLTIKLGQKVAIVGQSGSGKTTLARMLLGFYQPESGEITIGGTELSCISKSLLRKKISYMTQEIFLFADTIKNNICCNFGSLGSDVSDVKLRRATTKSARSLHCDPSAQSANLAYPTERPDQLDSPNPQSSDLIEGCAGYKNDDDELSHFKEVCRICGVDDFVSKMPFGYGTRLDESGSNLSGGQRQRIALARALLRNPDIMVLDEATSSLDSATEKSVTGSLLAATKDKTCIIITHRSSTIAQCDWVIAIENGKIVKQGTPNEFISEVV